VLQKSGTTHIDIDEFNLVESDSRKDKEEIINYASEHETKTKILERSIYLTGYDNLNLQRSKEYHILGWKDRPSKLSTGDYVFVFNTTGDKIESCFEIKSFSSNKNPIWHEESSYGDNGSQPLELVYPYRWDVVLIADRLDISKDTIFEFEPFSSDKKNFSMLLRNRHPRSLDNSQYTKFTTFLLDKIGTIAAKDNREQQEFRQEQLHKQDLKVFDDDKLPELTTEEIKIGYQKVSEELLISEEKVIEIVTALASGRHVLLAGPIGTGKTHLARMIPEVFWESLGGYIAEEHTATADWSTQDVIGGIMPKMQNGKVVYEIQYGCAVDTIRKNWQYGIDGGSRIQFRSSARDTPYRGIWLVIDEFNRADIDKSFGQLFTALRSHSLKIPTDEIGDSYRNLNIPEDYRIIGTLNTADKHFLFGLSDALKSRFAYIEIDIPSKEDHNKEIYYAMKNAISELRLSNLNSLVSLDSQNKKINEGTSNQGLYTRAYQAYYFLDSVRLFKKLGTAMLQLIYQNMLVATRITGDEKMALDNSLTSTLVPQLEGLPQAEIGTISALHGDGLVQFFSSAYKSPNRQSYSRTFMQILRYLQVRNPERLHNDFVNGLLKGEDDNTWMPIQLAYDAIKNNYELTLSRLKHAIDDLNEAAVI
jgi:MoxR-like ATPase